MNQADIDWPNVAEEIEALGKDEKRELASKISTIMEHLLKLEAPGLRRTVPAVIAEELGGARTEAAASLADNSETPRIIIDAVVHSENQMLGDWQP